LYDSRVIAYYRYTKRQPLIANVGIVKSKNSNSEKTPVRGFFLIDFSTLASGFGLTMILGSGLASVKDI